MINLISFGKDKNNKIYFACSGCLRIIWDENKDAGHYIADGNTEPRTTWNLTEVLESHKCTWK